MSRWGEMMCVSEQPGGRFDDGTARLWDVATHGQIAVLSAKGAGAVTSVAFNPGGTMLATGSDDGTARLWDVATHGQIPPLMPASTLSVTSVAFSPDGKTLATGSDDGTARLWDVATHTQTGASLPAGTKAVTAVALSPDGKTLATASDDGTARLWGLVYSGNLQKRVCSIADRSLTPQEWNEYVQSESFQPVCAR